MTIATQIAKQLGNDGQQWETGDGRTLEQLCSERGGAADYEHRGTTSEIARWTFKDGSVITAHANGWDLGFVHCWCWQEAGHTDECPRTDAGLINVVREAFEAAQLDGEPWSDAVESALTTEGIELLPGWRSIDARNQVAVTDECSPRAIWCGDDGRWYTTPWATDLAIRALREEARAHDDPDTAVLCCDALGGDSVAIVACARVIADAEAMQ